MPTRRLIRLSFVLALAACAASQPRHEPPQKAQLARAVAPPARLDPREPLPAPAQTILKGRMVNHARDMTDLVAAIMVLDYERIHQHAVTIAGDASLSRPLTADATELNSALPEMFFTYQDDLRRNARLLATSAEHMAAFEVADGYGRLSQSCVRCHATYRAGR